MQGHPIAPEGAARCQQAAAQRSGQLLERAPARARDLLLVARLELLVLGRREGTDEENEAILERVNASGEIFISHTKLNERYVLRLAIGSDRTTEDDVRRAWDVLRAR